MRRQSAAILVLGDLNRSPRMLNHCKAISQNMQEIDEINLIGFWGGDLRSDIALDRKIKVHYIPEKINNYLKKLPKILFLLSALIRITLQIFFLFYILLFKISRPEFLILQNPPGIPAMYICAVVCFLRRCKFIIDWHNYGYTILQVNGRNKIISLVAKIYEKIYGKCSDLNFCVSEAMKQHLKREMGIEAINLPDRAIKGVFNRLCLRESHLLFKKYCILDDVLTVEDENKVIGYKRNRPILMLSSTSWTPDEDFDLLLKSFKITEIKLLGKNNATPENLRKVLFVITGRGPMKEAFFKKVKESNLKLFDVQSLWLDSDDYPKLLGSAELGVCLHYSSSGFDLPMKVVDMFSAGLPVAAVYYDTIKELVQDGQNGFLFKNEEALSEILIKVIMDYSQQGYSEELDKFRYNLKEFGNYDWVLQWKDVVYNPIVRIAHLKRKKD
jgi:beta-1,4-mannosyltransferase